MFLQSQEAEGEWEEYGEGEEYEEAEDSQEELIPDIILDPEPEAQQSGTHH